MAAAGESAPDAVRDWEFPPWAVTVVRGAGLLVGLVGAVVLSVFGAFLTPFRIGTVLVPVSLVIAIAGPILVMRFVRYVTGGALPMIIAGVAWVAATFPLANVRAEGDLVLTQQWVALLYLFLGPVVVAIVCYRSLIPARGTPTFGQSVTPRAK